MSSSDNQRFSKDEIQAIFRRAAERQEAARGDTSDSGLTLDELRQIGEESGLDPAHVEAAAVEVARGDVDRSPEASDEPTGIERFYGTSTSAHLERVVPGTVEAKTWREMVTMMEAIFQNAGESTEAGHLREWQLSSSLGFDKRIFNSSSPGDWLKVFDSQPTKGPVTAELRPEGDGTRISMDYSMSRSQLWEGPGFAALFLTITLVLTAVLAFVGEPVVLIPTAVMLLLAVGMGTFFRMSHRSEITRTKERMAKAMDRLVHIQAVQHGTTSAASTPATASSAATESRGPLLDADHVSSEREPDVEASRTTAPHRTRS